MTKLVDRQRSKTTSPREWLAGLPVESQAKLLDPAEPEFVAHGFEGASLNRILAAAGMSKGQAYYYFVDKADLYRAVIDRGLKRMEKSMDSGFPQPMTAAEFWWQVAKIFAQITKAMQQDESLAALARGIYKGPGTQAALAEPLAHIRARADRLIAIGQSVGAVRTDLPQTLLGDVLFGAAREIDRWLAAHWPNLEKAEALRLNAKAVDMIASMAAPAPER